MHMEPRESQRYGPPAESQSFISNSLAEMGAMVAAAQDLVTHHAA